MNYSKLTKVVLSLFVFLLAVNTSVYSQEWSSEQKEAWGITKKMSEFWANRDLDGYMSCLHENFIGWFQNDPLPLKKESLQNWEKFNLSNVKIHHQESRPVAITITGNIAIINQYGSSIREDENGKKLTYSKWTITLIEEEGGWLILSMHGGLVLDN